MDKESAVVSSDVEEHPHHPGILREVFDFFQEHLAIIGENETAEYSESEDSDVLNDTAEDPHNQSVMIQTEPLSSSEEVTMEDISHRLRESEQAVETQFHAMDELAKKERQEFSDFVNQLKTSLQIAENSTQDLQEKLLIQNTQFADQMDDYRKKLSNLTAENSALKEENAQLISQVDSVSQNYQKTIETLVERMHFFEQKDAEKSSLLDALRNENTELNQEVLTNRSRLKSSEDDQLKLKSKVVDLKETFAKEKLELVRLIDELQDQCRLRISEKDLMEHSCKEFMAVVGRISDRQVGLEDRCRELEELHHALHVEFDEQDVRGTRVQFIDMQQHVEMQSGIEVENFQFQAMEERRDVGYSASREFSNSSTLCTSLREERDELPFQLALLEEKVQLLSSENVKRESEYTKKLQMADSAIKTYEESIRSMENQAVEMRQDNLTLSSRIESMDAELTDLRNQKSKEINFYASQLDEHMKANIALEKRCQSLTSQLLNYCAIESLSSSLNNCRIDLEQFEKMAQARLTKASRRVESLQEMIRPFANVICGRISELSRLQLAEASYLERIDKLVAGNQSNEEMLKAAVLTFKCNNEELCRTVESQRLEIEELNNTLKANAQMKVDVEHKLMELSKTIDLEREDLQQRERNLELMTIELNGNFSALEESKRMGEDRIAVLENRLKSDECNRCELDANLTEARRLIEHLQSKLDDSRTQQDFALSESAAHLNMTSKELTESRLEIRKLKEELLEQKNCLNHQSGDFEQRISTFQKEFQSSQEIVNDLQFRLENSVPLEDYSGLQKKLAGYEEESAELKSRNAHLSEDLADLKTKYDTNSQLVNCQYVLKNLSSLEIEAVQVKSRLQRLKEEKDEVVLVLRNQLDMSSARLRDSESKAEKLQTECQLLQGSVAEITQKCRDLEARLHETEIKPACHSPWDEESVSVEKVKDLTHRLSISEQLKNDLMNQVAVMGVQHDKECNELLSRITDLIGKCPDEDDEKESEINGARKNVHDGEQMHALVESLRIAQDEAKNLREERNLLMEALRDASRQLREAEIQMAYFQKNIVRLGALAKDSHLVSDTQNNLQHSVDLLQREKSSLEKQNRLINASNLQLQEQVSNLETHVLKLEVQLAESIKNKRRNDVFTGFGNFHAQLTPITSTPLRASDQLDGSKFLAVPTPLATPKVDSTLGSQYWAQMTPLGAQHVHGARTLANESFDSFNQSFTEQEGSAVFDGFTVSRLKQLLTEEQKIRRKLEKELQKSHERCAKLAASSESQWKEAFITLKKTYKWKGQTDSKCEQTQTSAELGRNQLWIALCLKVGQLDRLVQALRKNDRHTKRLLRERTGTAETLDVLWKAFTNLSEKFKELQSEIAETVVILDDHRPPSEEIVEITDDPALLSALRINPADICAKSSAW